MKKIILGLLIIVLIIIILLSSNNTDEQTYNTNIQQESHNEYDEETSNKSFILTEGKIGIYGQKEVLDGYEQIIYNIPVGKYTVVFNTNLASAQIGTIFVEKNDVITENGEKIHPIVNTYYFNNSNNFSNVIEVEENQHILITVNSSFTFTEI